MKHPVLTSFWPSLNIGFGLGTLIVVVSFLSSLTPKILTNNGSNVGGADTSRFSMMCATLPPEVDTTNELPGADKVKGSAFCNTLGTCV